MDTRPELLCGPVLMAAEYSFTRHTAHGGIERPGIVGDRVGPADLYGLFLIPDTQSSAAASANRGPCSQPGGDERARTAETTRGTSQLRALCWANRQRLSLGIVGRRAAGNRWHSRIIDRYAAGQY